MLPITPRHLLALGKKNIVSAIPRALIDQINIVQIRTADRYIYLHPRSTKLETFARETARRWRADCVSPYRAPASAPRKKP
ncbi:DUF4238 domain-containing protein [Streptomyces beigongshangae]|uniref:DUF4238 domain-containing protein n=1 Tax=Streptomyces beigongshangae TaxID=2841597 RepID=UPI001C842A5F|nr:DUF4238 domain-containing protein [Streptomyces sp. REN17]